jgi:hypothetical protein
MARSGPNDAEDATIRALVAVLVCLWCGSVPVGAGELAVLRSAESTSNKTDQWGPTATSGARKSNHFIGSCGSSLRPVKCFPCEKPTQPGRRSPSGKLG